MRSDFTAPVKRGTGGRTYVVRGRRPKLALSFATRVARSKFPTATMKMRPDVTCLSWYDITSSSVRPSREYPSPWKYAS